MMPRPAKASYTEPTMARTRFGSCVWYSSSASFPVNLPNTFAASTSTALISGVFGVTKADSSSGFTAIPCQ